MGIDIYMRYRGMPQADQEAQYTGFSITSGGIGYLRESYGGGPYATYDFVAEAFVDPTEPYPEGDDEAEAWYGYVPIPAETLRERLPAALTACTERYKGSDELVEKACQSYCDFVALAERWESEGKTPLVYASY